MSEPKTSRRIVFHGLTGLGIAAVLAGCGGGDSDPTTDASDATPTPTPTDSSSASASPSESESASPRDSPAGPGAQVLATTDEIPVGGGIVLTAERIVIAQPEAGQFRAWSAICKHEGRTVGTVEGNTITCNFHGSQYDSATGDVTNGPATTGLDPIAIQVAKGKITEA